MTQLNDIIDWLSNTLDTPVTLEELRDVFPTFSPHSIRRIMGVETIKGTFERISRATYKIKSLYFKIAQTKTSHYENSNKGDIDLDATISGWIKKDKINFKTNRINEAVGTNLNKKFVSAIMDLLIDDDDFTGLGFTELSFSIEGMEIRSNDFDYTKPKYDTQWTIEELIVTTETDAYEVAKNEDVIIAENELY